MSNWDKERKTHLKEGGGEKSESKKRREDARSQFPPQPKAGEPGFAPQQISYADRAAMDKKAEEGKARVSAYRQRRAEERQGKAEQASVRPLDSTPDQGVFHPSQNAIPQEIAKLLPKGAKPDLYGDGLQWSKTGGHSGSDKVNQIIAKAKASGFVPVESKDGNTPDGSYIGQSDVLRHPSGHELHAYKNFGPTVGSNRFKVTIRPPKRKP